MTASGGRQVLPDVLRPGLDIVFCGTAAGNDDELPPGSFDPGRLEKATRRYRPRLLAFTSKRAAAEFLGRPVAYGPQATAIEATQLFVLPSPSGAARRHWDESRWLALARLRASLGTRMLQD